MPTPPPKGGRPEQAAPKNSIRMDQAQLDRMLNERAAANAAKAQSVRRDHVRWNFRVASVEIRLTHPGRTTASLIVACRDLSAGGLGVLHSSFIYPGTKCSVLLPKVDGGRAEVEGVVVRCQHIDGIVHEIGIKFNQNVQAKDFVKLDPFSDGFVLEKVDPEKLKGSVLLIEESALDQSLIRHFMRPTQVNLIAVAGKDDAMKHAIEGVDLIVCDFDRSDEDAAKIVQAIRESGVSTPIIMLTADTSAGTRDKLAKAQANAFISKPLKQEMLYRAIAEFIVVDDTGGGLNTSLPSGHPNLGLLDSFIKQVRIYGTEMAECVKADDVQKCRKLCLQIAGAAPVMGFEKLAEMAQAAEAALSSTASTQGAIGPIRSVMSACKRVTSRVAA